MIVSDEIRKCVGFLGFKMADSTYRFAGTAFLLARGEPNNILTDSIYFVTARHVIDNIRIKGLDKIYLRLNFKDGNAQWIPIPIENWFTHPSDQSIDVAILNISLRAEYDHLVIPYSLCISDKRMSEDNVGLGDEVFITGLFRHHFGNLRNIPIVRVGNLACLTEEKISTSLGEMSACLIEARSIGGLSGSPVFLHLGATRTIKGQTTFTSGPLFYLFGLIHGHYDTKTNNIDVVGIDQTDDLSVERVNTGIAIVVPFRKIDEVVTIFEKREALRNNSSTSAHKYDFINWT